MHRSKLVLGKVAAPEKIKQTTICTALIGLLSDILGLR